MKIKKGDNVKIITGKDSGKKGKVLKVLPKENKVIVEGLNLRIKNTKPKKEGEKGQRMQFPASLNISNVMIVCPKCGKLVRLGYKELNNDKKVRICKKCEEVI
ncbi:MAG: large subunit ribosomal protein L24 [Parcubacteria group bacterium Athens1014_10]|nr:MAG: large subunit ribosomal protein L24 [Parcubacteria group bacterium Athens1014_10]TSD05488.1 MAG: large subunit ribosomal protein L24 [Parcubacteria group bacterium Athens0714_12]